MVVSLYMYMYSVMKDSQMLVSKCVILNVIKATTSQPTLTRCVCERVSVCVCVCVHAVFVLVYMWVYVYVTVC